MTAQPSHCTLAVFVTADCTVCQKAKTSMMEMDQTYLSVKYIEGHLSANPKSLKEDPPFLPIAARV